MPKIMDIIAKETKGTSYNTYKYSFDSIGLPSIVYDDDSSKIMKWQDSAETVKHIKPINLKPLADMIVGEPPLISYFLDGSRHVFKVEDIAYNKQVFPVVAGQIGVGCCKCKKLNESEELKKLNLNFSAIIPYATSKAGFKGCINSSGGI